MARRTVRRFELREIEDDHDGPVERLVDTPLTIKVDRIEVPCEDPDRWLQGMEAEARKRVSGPDMAWKERALKAEAAFAEARKDEASAREALGRYVTHNGKLVDERDEAKTSLALMRQDRDAWARAALTGDRAAAAARVTPMQRTGDHYEFDLFDGTRIRLTGKEVAAMAPPRRGCTCDPTSTARPTGGACCAAPVATTWAAVVDARQEARCADRYRDLDARLGKIEGPHASTDNPWPLPALVSTMNELAKRVARFEQVIDVHRSANNAFAGRINALEVGLGASGDDGADWVMAKRIADAEGRLDHAARQRKRIDDRVDELESFAQVTSAPTVPLDRHFAQIWDRLTAIEAGLGIPAAMGASRCERLDKLERRADAADRVAVEEMNQVTRINARVAAIERRPVCTGVGAPGATIDERSR